MDTMHKMSDIADLNHKIFVLDLEFLGRLPDCRIWEIGIIMLEDGQICDQFEATVDPFPGQDVFPQAPEGYFTPTRAYLTERNARPLEQVLRALVRWIRSRTSKECAPLFVAHGAFRSDKPVFEAHSTHVKFRIPQNWHWADSLVLAREQYPRRDSYTLASMYEQCFGPYQQSHRALDDARMLASLITGGILIVEGFAYPSYTLPLQTISGIGPKTEKLLQRAGVVSAVHLKECLLHIARQYPVNNFHASTMWLTRIIGRDSQDIVRNILVC